jgi:CMP-N-acetylneuraminic acid synthetase
MRPTEWCVAIITARGGSKRIPGKNIRDFCGRPLIWWTIEAARRSGVFSDIIVNTDDDEIASFSAESGAEVYRRPPELGADDTRSDEVLAEMGQTLFGGNAPDGCVFVLEPTSPTRLSNLIPGGVAEWARWDDGMVVSISSVSNYWWGMVVEGDSLQAVTPEMWGGGISRPTVYALTAAFYAFPSTIFHAPCPSGWWNHISPIRGYEVSDIAIVELDEEEDWARGEEIMRSQVLPDWGLA